MLVLYRKADCPFCDAVEEQIKDLVLAHRVVTVRNEVAPASKQTHLPVLTEGTQRFEGEAGIRRFLSELSAEVTIGRQFQSDACYLNPDRPDECL